MAAKPGKKKTNQKIALETRILATFSLIEICKTDAQNIGSADIEELYKKIAALNEKAFEDEKPWISLPNTVWTRLQASTT